MKKILGLALAAGLFFATAGAAEARHHHTNWGAYNYGYYGANPYAGYYPPSAYNNWGLYYGANPYYGNYNPYYHHSNNTLRQIGNALLRGWF